jgi:hypothetical protein
LKLLRQSKIKTILAVALCSQWANSGALDATIEAFEQKPGYVQPIATFMGTLHNAGWFSSAKVSKEFGWSIGMPITIAGLTQDDQFYNRSQSSNCAEIEADFPSIYCPYDDVQTKRIPTIFGPKTQVQFETASPDPVNNAISTTREFAEDGFLANMVVFPMINPSVGFSGEHFEGKIRGIYIPLPSALVNGGGLSIYHFGLGMNHDLGHYFKDKDLPVDFSFTANYTYWGFAFEPGDTYTGELVVGGHVAKFGFLVGKRVESVEFLLDIGYEMSSMGSSGALVKISDGESINPNINIDGRNGFTIGLSFVGHWGYDFMLGGSYGSQPSGTINFLQYKSKETGDE